MRKLLLAHKVCVKLQKFGVSASTTGSELILLPLIKAVLKKHIFKSSSLLPFSNCSPRSQIIFSFQYATRMIEFLQQQKQEICLKSLHKCAASNLVITPSRQNKLPQCYKQVLFNLFQTHEQQGQSFISSIIGVHHLYFKEVFAKIIYVQVFNPD